MLAEQSVPGWQSRFEPDEVVCVSGRGYEVDARIPNTPSRAPGAPAHPFPPLPPRGSLGRGVLTRPRAQFHKRPRLYTHATTAKT